MTLLRERLARAEAFATVRFRIGSHWHLCDAALVEEVVLDPTIRVLPDLPTHVLGLVRSRDRLRIAVDVAAALDVEREPGPFGACLLVCLGGGAIAVATDEASEVTALDAGSVRAIGSIDRGGALVGVARLGDELHTVVDLGELLTAQLGMSLPEETMRTTRQTVAQVQLVVFRLGTQQFALDVFGVLEVLRYQPVTPVPRAPDFVEGVISVRGELVPVVDGRRRFDLPVREPTSETRIVVVAFGEGRLGLVVDAVLEVLRLPETEITEPPAYVRALAAEYMRGIVRQDDRLIITLALDRVLSGTERIALEAVDLETVDLETVDLETVDLETVDLDTAAPDLPNPAGAGGA